MGIAVGSDSLYAANAQLISDNAKTDNLQSKIKNNNATDEELMDVCKSFESYMIEQVFKEMKKTVPKQEEDNEYLNYFGDMMYEEYAKNAVDNQDFGIAKMLFESMKRNS